MEWRGFELHPETPAGGVPLTRLFGPRVAAMQDYMKRFAAGFGVTRMGSPAHLPNTRRALAMAEFARDDGKFDRFHDLAMDAHWIDGRNLEDDGDLRALAIEAGLDPEAALRATLDPAYLERVDAIREEAGDMGVSGIPTFFIGQKQVVGCQPYEVLAEAARRAGAKPRAGASS